MRKVVRRALLVLLAVCVVFVVGVVLLGILLLRSFTAPSQHVEPVRETHTPPTATATPQDETTQLMPTPQENTPPEDKHPLLTETQEARLEQVGVDPATLPQTISPELRTCVEQALGAARVQEILDGDTPTITDAVKARGCL